MTMMNVSKRLGFWAALCGLVLAGALLSGCQTGGSDPRFSEVPGLNSPPPAPATTPTMGTPAAAASPDSARDPYRLRANDAVIINFTDLPSAMGPQQPLLLTIKEDGTIRLIQDQVFVAAGKTRNQLEKEIHDRYVPDFFKTLTVMVGYQPQSQFYNVGGEVKLPNRQVYIGSLTVLGAIRSCGDFTDFANKKKVELTRADGAKFVINCVKAQRDPKLDLEVFPGDRIWVPRKSAFSW